MTNDPIAYSFHKRMGLNSGKKLFRSTQIQLADQHDVDDVWELSKFHKHIKSIPFKDSIEHLIRNPRCMSAVSILHTSEASSSPEKDFEEGIVIEEEVVGFCCVKPVDRPTHIPNYIKVSIPCLLHHISLGEEEVADLIYETLTQYVLAKTTTDVPTKLEVTTWLTPTETNWFKTVVGFIDARFHDSYLPLKTADLTHETRDKNAKPLEIGSPNKITKGILMKQRRNLNNPENYIDVEHRLLFPRLPAPIR